eukprot:gene9061-10000_t
MSEKILPWGSDKIERPRPAKVWDVYWVGLTIVIGGQIISWNEANYKRRVAFTGSSLRRYKSYVLSSAFSSKRNSGRSDGPSVVSKVASLRVSNKPGESVLLVEEARDETFVSLTNDRVASVDLVDSDKSAELSLHLPIHPHVSYSSSICMMDLHNEGKREEFFN